MARHWPDLRYEALKDTVATVHRWIQIVGKIKFRHEVPVNHSWQTALYLTARGLTTGNICAPGKTFSIGFDFVSHVLRIETEDGEEQDLPLRAESVAEFYVRCMEALRAMGVETPIHERPNEVEDAIPFPEDTVHKDYDPFGVQALWKAMLRSERVMREFRSRFVGKVSPVHLWWGGFDLAVTRFSGRPAPEHPGGVPNLPDLVVKEAYSHEVSSCGFWPGDARFEQATYFAYFYPKPEGYERARIGVPGAFWEPVLGEFLLPYSAVRASADPEATLLRFFEETYAVGADLARWDRPALEESAFLRELRELRKAGAPGARKTREAA